MPPENLEMSEREVERSNAGRDLVIWVPLEGVLIKLRVFLAGSRLPMAQVRLPQDEEYPDKDSTGVQAFFDSLIYKDKALIKRQHHEPWRKLVNQNLNSAGMDRFFDALLGRKRNNLLGLENGR